MSDERYLIVSYVLFGLTSLCLGGVSYLLLRAPFAAIAETAAGKVRSRFLKRALPVVLTLAGVVGFLSISYTQQFCGPRKYEDIVKDRQYLVEVNRRQVKSTANWLVSAVFVSSLVVLLCMIALRKLDSTHTD